MADKIKINNVEIWQPDEGLAYALETTYSEDTQRVIQGNLVGFPLFTVEQVGYTATNIPLSAAATILQMVGRGQPFNLTYYSVFYGAWRTASFYVGKGSANIGRVSASEQVLDTLSFNMTSVNPL